MTDGYCCAAHHRMLPAELRWLLRKPLLHGARWKLAITAERKELHERAQAFFDDEFKRLLGKGL